jgi:hypothetical protein
MNRRNRRNIKLSYDVASRFEKPYEQYLEWLLQVSIMRQESFGFGWRSETRTSRKEKRWTLWMSVDLKRLYDERKATLAPDMSHGEFVVALLNYCQPLGLSFVPAVKGLHEYEGVMSQSTVYAAGSIDNLYAINAAQSASTLHEASGTPDNALHFFMQPQSLAMTSASFSAPNLLQYEMPYLLPQNTRMDCEILYSGQLSNQTNEER